MNILTTSNSERDHHNPSNSNESKKISSSKDTKSDLTRRTSWRKENLTINTDLDSKDEVEILNQIKDFNTMKEFSGKKIF